MACLILRTRSIAPGTAERRHRMWRKSVDHPARDQKWPHFRKQGRARRWVLEPVEVHRVYPLVAVDGANAVAVPDRARGDSATDILVEELRAMIACNATVTNGGIRPRGLPWAYPMQHRRPMHRLLRCRHDYAAPGAGCARRGER
jgi:hypothetical protein